MKAEGESFAFFRWMSFTGAAPGSKHGWQCLGCRSAWVCGQYATKWQFSCTL